MTSLTEAVREEIQSGAHLEDLVVLVHCFNQQISQEISKLGLHLHISPFVPHEKAYLLNTERCNKALAWSLGYRKENAHEKVASSARVLSHVDFNTLCTKDR